MTEKVLFGKIDGREVYKYILKGDGIEVSVLDYGATVQSFKVGETEIVQSFSVAEDYKNRPGYVCGAIGRVANRIANAEFTLDGKVYKLTANEGTKQLHGGTEGFNHKFFDASEIPNGVKMTYFSRDGEEGFPGNLTAEIEFTVTGKSLDIAYSAVSDKDTLFAPTHHFYFNMNGEVGEANSNLLAIYADGYTPVYKDLIPTGEIADVKGTPFDFRTLKRVDRDLAEGEIYDHNFVLNGGHAATIIGDVSGIKADIFTDMPCLQLYSGAGGKEKRLEKDVSARGGVALEPQFAPNAINTPAFEKPIIRANEEKKHFIRIEIG